MLSRCGVIAVRRRLLALYLVVACGGIAFIGCSRQGPDKWLARRPPLFKARGRITWNEKPAQRVLVVFSSKTFGVTATGLTNDLGEFVLSSYRRGDGAPAGEHAVTITKNLVATDKNGNELDFMFNSTPEKYANAETSGLSATVAQDNGNFFAFELVGAAQEWKGQ